MDFVRKKKRGVTSKTCKVWFSTDGGHYKIMWVKEAFGVRTKPHYHATVHCFRTSTDTYKQWDFAGRRGPYKTFEAAVEACEHNHKMWLEAISISESKAAGRKDRFRSMEFRSRIKTVRVKKKHKTVSYQRTMCGTPIWVRKIANAVLTEFFSDRLRGRTRADDDEEEDECLPSPGVTGEALPTTEAGSSTPSEMKPSDSSPTSPASIPASSVKAGAASPSPVASTKSRRKGKSATAVVETAACPNPNSKKSTKTSPTNTSRKSVSTKKRSKRAA